MDQVIRVAKGSILLSVLWNIFYVEVLRVAKLGGCEPVAYVANDGQDVVKVISSRNGKYFIQTQGQIGSVLGITKWRADSAAAT